MQYFVSQFPPADDPQCNAHQPAGFAFIQAPQSGLFATCAGEQRILEIEIGIPCARVPVECGRIFRTHRPFI